jgi:ATPase family protein associated with various cellular activities (AAA)/winged helix domain-containing protein
MSDAESWLKNNDAYLAGAIDSVHRRLGKLAPSPTAAEEPASPASDPQPPTTTRRWLGSRFRGRETIEVRVGRPSSRLLDAGPETAPSLAEGHEGSAAAHLKQALGLSSFELDTLLLCAAMELDTRTADLCARAQGKGRAYPTFSLAMALFDEPAWEALSPERPLRYWRLLEITQPEGQPLTTSGLRADERIVNHLKGLNHIDDRLMPFLSALAIPTDDRTIDLSPSQQYEAHEIAAHVRACRNARAVTRLPIVQLVGPAHSDKAHIAALAARELGVGLYRVSATELPQRPADLNNWIRLWQRETALLPVGLVVDAGDEERGSPDGAQTLQHFLAHLETLVFLLRREPIVAPTAEILTIDIERPTPFEQMAAWTEALGIDPEPEPPSISIPARLAGQFDLAVSDIRQLAARQIALERTTLPDLWHACLAHNRPGLDLLAQRIVPRATWEDLVLPETTTRMLREIADQVDHRSQVYDTWGFRSRMSRGLGISVLFDGETGTGKTMAAEVIANQLQLNLFRIDLSAVVSKYLGETEKNLRRVFDAADGGGGILFFDEADSIFGKRSEVKDSHDRYANIETNYLLQRIEAYGGLAILATNMKSALDHAFMRRLRFIVRFPVPAHAERQRIWTRVFPPETPLEESDPAERVDFNRLARVNLTGGSISNAALNAAFLAARSRTPVTMSLLVTAIHTELKKTDRQLQPV